MKNLAAVSTSLQLPEVRVRFPAEKETLLGSTTQLLPVVVEPLRESSLEFLSAFVSDQSDLLLSTIHRYGAVLFRGFRVSSEKDFEKIVLRLKSFNPMRGYFMAEPGRTVIRGTRFVFHTNSILKTGGGFSPLGRVHTENFSTLDVPRYQAFWSKTACGIGGETALVDTLEAFDVLGPTTRAMLEAKPVEMLAYPVSEVALRYRLSEGKVISFFESVGVPILTERDEKFVVVQKPCIFVHPSARKKALQIDFSAMPGLDQEFQKCVIGLYSSLKWGLHRFVWDHMRAMRALQRYSGAKLALYLAISKLRHRPKYLNPLVGRVQKEEVANLAKRLAESASLIRWRQGDLLIFDNTRTAHAGMPGLGPRALRVMLGNPIPIEYPLSSGVLEVSINERHRSFDDRLKSTS